MIILIYEKKYLRIKNLKELNEVGKPNPKCNIEAVNPVNFQLNK